MTKKTEHNGHTRTTCISCGGSGQISYFQGESRFVTTWEECPECVGTGYVESDPGDINSSGSYKPDTTS